MPGSIEHHFSREIGRVVGTNWTRPGEPWVTAEQGASEEVKEKIAEEQQKMEESQIVYYSEFAIVKGEFEFWTGLPKMHVAVRMKEFAMLTKQCLTDQELADFDLGSLAGERHEEVARHLDSCAECAGRFERLEQQSDGVLAKLRLELPSEVLGEDSEMQRLMDAAAALRDTSISNQRRDLRGGNTAIEAAAGAGPCSGSHTGEGARRVGPLGWLSRVEHAR